jgi:hypothetical protein
MRGCKKRYGQHGHDLAAHVKDRPTNINYSIEPFACNLLTAALTDQFEPLVKIPRHLAFGAFWGRSPNFPRNLEVRAQGDDYSA